MLVESGILGFGFWNSTFGIWNSAQKSGIPQQLESVIQVQLTRNLESIIWSPESTTWNPSGIKDFLGLPYMGRNKRNIHHETRTAPHMRLTELTLSQFILLYGITVY